MGRRFVAVDPLCVQSACFFLRDVFFSALRHIVLWESNVGRYVCRQAPREDLTHSCVSIDIMVCEVGASPERYCPCCVG